MPDVGVAHADMDRSRVSFGLRSVREEESVHHSLLYAVLVFAANV